MLQIAQIVAKKVDKEEEQTAKMKRKRENIDFDRNKEIKMFWKLVQNKRTFSNKRNRIKIRTDEIIWDETQERKCWEEYCKDFYGQHRDLLKRQISPLKMDVKS